MILVSIDFGQMLCLSRWHTEAKRHLRRSIASRSTDAH